MMGILTLLLLVGNCDLEIKRKTKKKKLEDCSPIYSVFETGVTVNSVAEVPVTLTSDPTS